MVTSLVVLRVQKNELYFSVEEEGGIHVVREDALIVKKRERERKKKKEQKTRRLCLVYKNSYEWKKTKGAPRGNQRINSFFSLILCCFTSLLHLHSLSFSLSCPLFESGAGEERT